MRWACWRAGGAGGGWERASGMVVVVVVVSWFVQFQINDRVFPCCAKLSFIAGWENHSIEESAKIGHKNALDCFDRNTTMHSSDRIGGRTIE